MKNTILLLTICFWSYSCTFQGFSQSFENIVTLEDMNGKPIKGHEVRVLRNTSNSFPSSFDQELKSAITDNNGQAILNYNLNISDSSQDYAYILGEDDKLLKAVNFVTHTLTNKQSKIIERTDTIRMDSLVPFKFRVKTEKSDIRALRVYIFSYSGSIQRNFADEYLFSNMSKIDTTTSVLVYSKADFIIRVFTNNVSTLTNEIPIQNNVNRKDVFLLEL